MTEKILGYVLFFIGLAVICYSGRSVYQVFTRRALPVKLFTFPGIRLDTAAFISGGSRGNSQLGEIVKSLPPDVVSRLPAGILEQSQVQNERKPGEATGPELISGEMLNFSSNLFAHLMLMGFLASVGYKIASLGVQLMRPIMVKLSGVQTTQKE